MKHTRPHNRLRPDFFLDCAILGFFLLLLLVPAVSADDRLVADDRWCRMVGTHISQQCGAS